MLRKQRHYRYDRRQRPGRRYGARRKGLWLCLGCLLVIGLGAAGYVFFLHPSHAAIPFAATNADTALNFDDSVTASEKQVITAAVKSQKEPLSGRVSVHVTTSLTKTAGQPVLNAYVPVMNAYTTRLKVSKAALPQLPIKAAKGTDPALCRALASALGLSSLSDLGTSIDQINDTDIAFMPVSDLSDKVRLLTFNGSYYLDTFAAGAVFRQASFSGPGAKQLDSFHLNNLPTKADTLKVNMTGVTALTRLLQKKLNQNNEPAYFSAEIGKFLKDADITHTSNEVSFKPGCPYSINVFCADPRFIDTLKDSGFNLIELTGNHNNDVGAAYNASTIKQYHQLGWHTFGGGLNAEEAAKPYVADEKGSKVAFFGYNYADSPSGGPIATATTAGANSFSFAKIKSDIAQAKNQGAFAIVDLQYSECYSYPTEHTEYPICDKPIGSQEADFRKIIDLGADMVIGTQAHQPQTYELYKGKQIYYGLGNLYFEQVQWPGTERGIILTHYFRGGKLLQTRLTPTIYDTDFQTHIASTDQATYLLNRFKTARQAL